MVIYGCYHACPTRAEIIVSIRTLIIYALAIENLTVTLIYGARDLTRIREQWNLSIIFTEHMLQAVYQSVVQTLFY